MGTGPAGTGAVPRRYASGLRRREQILDAATELFVEAGFRPVSLRDIAARSGLSHPGLLRHFGSKDEILDAVVDRFEQANQRWLAESGLRELAGPLPFGEFARHNAALPGYTELFATLAGEATSRSHPAHLRMRERYRRLREIAAEQLGPLTDSDEDARDEATRLIAAWDGLQLLSLYDADTVDVAERLERHLAGLRGEPPARPLSSYSDVGTPSPPAANGEQGYAPGRARRAQIVRDAAALFARRGFGGTSLREIAERVGISKSTLLHHVSSKDELLASVLAHRDAETIDASDEGPARARLLALSANARLNARRAPGLIELYAVLSCEAATPPHPAHDYFARRFGGARAHFARLLEQLAADGESAPGLDPEQEGTWLTALWDGLQYQWLYEPEAVDVPSLLDGHIRRLLGP